MMLLKAANLFIMLQNFLLCFCKNEIRVYDSIAMSLSFSCSLVKRNIGLIIADISFKRFEIISFFLS